MPSLLQQGSQEVGRHDDILSEFLVSHTFVSDGDVQVGNLLELPLNGGSDITELLLKRLVVGNWLWELTDSVKNWTQNLWDLLDKGISGKKEIVFLGPLLDEFLVLVEFLQVVKGGDIDVETH